MQFHPISHPPAPAHPASVRHRLLQGIPQGIRRSLPALGVACAMLGSLLSATPVRAEDTADAPSGQRQTSAERIALPAHGVPLSLHVEAMSIGEPSASSAWLSDGAGSDPQRRGPLRGMTDTRDLAPRSLGHAGLYAYVDLGSALPDRLRALIGQPDGGVTFELRPGNHSVIGPALGSMVRWHMSDGGQVSLRLRGGKLRLQYGLRF